VQFLVTEPAAEWFVELAGNTARVEQGRSASAGTTVTVSDAELEALATGAATVRQLYQRGAVRIDGEVAPAHRLGLLKGLI
jgi:3-hydroxyacyl-CoA dehydrogenase/3a,7a,12a-trihydroxy-5b-cholest-24-enoyl-CoA hydratase